MDGTYPAGIKPLAYESITVSTVVKTLTVPKGAVRATLGVEGQSIRYRLDGTDPTSSVGVLMKADAKFDIYGHAALKALKAIRVDGSDAVLSVQYFG